VKDLTQVEYRDIATLFAKGLPIEGDEYRAKVESYLDTIKALPREAKLALKMAYIFGSKAPREEREDLFQQLTLTLLKANVTDEKLAYSIARCDWLDWYRKYKIRQHTSLDSVVEDTEGNATTPGELLVGEVEFETKMDGRLDAELMWQKIPPDIKPLILKRLEGKALVTRYGRGRPKTDSALNDCERKRFNRWLHKEGYKLALA